jgi:hypothetical protein
MKIVLNLAISSLLLLGLNACSQENFSNNGHTSKHATVTTAKAKNKYNN